MDSEREDRKNLGGSHIIYTFKRGVYFVRVGYIMGVSHIHVDV